ncbi:MAG: hypothetical protein NTZ34_01855 [Chloroflexi bacterium]|nr:hypothetical protein [Chloroflexota bacterium]
MKEEKEVAPGRDWKRYLSVFLPVVLLIGFAIVFSGSSSSSDCGDSDCSSSSADLSGVCGEPANVDKSGTIRTLQSLTLKSGQTDMRCGYGVSWKYNWSKARKTPKTPNVSISVSASKSGSSKVNKSDTGGPDSWEGTYIVARSGGKDPVLGTITVTASFTPDVTTLLDSVNISMHLIYSTLKK